MGTSIGTRELRNSLGLLDALPVMLRLYLPTKTTSLEILVEQNYALLAKNANEVEVDGTIFGKAVNVGGRRAPVLPIPEIKKCKDGDNTTPPDTP